MATVLFIAVFAFLIFVCVLVMLWQATCWFFRTILSIPKYPPFYKPPGEPLPYYLDDRIKPAPAPRPLG
jgi:hypothetical protein